MARIKMHIPKAKLLFYPPCEVKCRLQNGVSTIASSRGRTIDLTTRDMGSELKYGLGKVLSIQNCLTLRLAFSHCVLCLNPIKGILNIVFMLTHTH